MINTEFLIIAGFVAVVILVISTISSAIIRKRITVASMFGKWEHKSGRLLGWMLVGLFFQEYLQLGYTLIGIALCFLCWVIYLVSHTLEKFTYGNHGFR